MWQKIKVWGFRKYYRFSSAREWRELAVDPTYNPLQIPGPGGPLQARMYRGGSSADKPLIVYFHGGGWVIGDLLSHHPFCQTLSQKSGCTVISVDYRLAPEHPFPAAADDCLAATRWVADHIGDFGPTNGRLVLAGDSAGANLATCTCLELDPGTRALVAGEIVKYPVVDHYSSSHPSYIERASGQLLTSKVMRWFWDTYLAGLAPDSAAARRAMPLHATNLAALPPTFLVTVEYDPLRDEGIAFGQRLTEAGVAVVHHHFENASHGFACSEGPTEHFNTVMEALTAWLRQLE